MVPRAFEPRQKGPHLVVQIRTIGFEFQGAMHFIASALRLAGKIKSVCQSAMGLGI